MLVFITELSACGYRVPIEPTSPSGRVEFPISITLAVLLTAFMIYWFGNFISQLSDFILAYGACNWYFSPDENRDALSDGAKKVTKYHLGSVALGSLLLSLV